MANDLQTLALAQREATRVLSTLTTQIRRQGEASRLAGGLLATQVRRRAEAGEQPGGLPAGSGTPLGAPAGATSSEVRTELNRLVSSRVVGSVADVRSEGSLTGRGRATSIPLVVTGERTVEEALNTTARSVQDLAASLGRNTSALEKNSRDLRDGLSGLVSGLLGGGSSKGGGGVLNFLTGGFGLASLGLKIAGLFGSRKKEPEPLLPFELPPSIALERANSNSILPRLPSVVRGNRNEVRAVAQDPVAAAPQVVVNVSAMDSQSFLDRSGDIALALRDAMLHMHPVNDLVGEV